MFSPYRYLQKTKPRKVVRPELHNGHYWPRRNKNHGGLAENIKKTTFNVRAGNIETSPSLSDKISGAKPLDLDERKSELLGKTQRRRKRKGRYLPVWCDESHPSGAWMRFASISNSCATL